MSFTIKRHVFTTLFMLAVLVEQCRGIVFIKDSTPKPRRRAKMCKFGNRNHTIGQSWHPYLEPNGIDFCITCKCTKNAFTHCARKRCPPVSCAGKKVPPGKCCPVCTDTAIKPTVALKQCNYKGNQYNSGQVWETTGSGNPSCAECVCNNGIVSCTIRLCKPLRCPEVMQRKERYTCCKKCGGLPLVAEGETPSQKYTRELQGSCLSKGLRYKNRDMWNPIQLPAEIRILHYPNCHLCSCQNTNVSCSTVKCPSLLCANPVKKHPKDCCKSCPNPKSSLFSPTIYASNSDDKTINGNVSRDCKFAKKVYKHNTSWSPDIPGMTAKLCVRCSCKFSRVSCDRTACKPDGQKCAGNCSIPTTKSPRPRQRESCSAERVEVYLLTNTGRKTKIRRAKQANNYVAKIVLIYSKDTSGYVKIRHWNVGDNGAFVRSSKLRQTRFEKRKSNYVKLGETKTGRINRFLNKERVLSRCQRNCKNKAQEFISVLRNRVRYFKKDCKPTNTFRSLMPSPL